MDRLLFALAQLNPTAGDIAGNKTKLIGARTHAATLGADIIVAPECYLTGYQIDDLVLLDGFLASVEAALHDLAKITADGGPAIIVGAPRGENSRIYNAVFVLDQGRITAVRDKVHLAIGGVFDDPRNFSQGAMPSPVMLRGVLMGLPICYDMWHSDVIECLQESGAEMLIIPNGSPFDASKIDARMAEAVKRVHESNLPLVYINLLGGVDDEVFDGGSFALNPGGKIGAYLPQFEEVTRLIEANRTADGWVFSGEVVKPDDGEQSLWQAMMLGVRDYTQKNGFERAVLGLSGGVDSAMVAVLAVDALGVERVDAVMMPSPYTSVMSREDAKTLAQNLGINLREIDIEPPMQAVAKAMGEAVPQGLSGVAAENLQSRLRGLALMSLSNTEGQLLLTTGNKSEYATGYATLYGDMCGGYAPLIDCWKTQVFALCHWRNGNVPKGSLGAGGAIIPERILTRPPSAELREGQQDSDSLPDYAILDPIMKGLVEDMASHQSLINQGHDAGAVAVCVRLLLASEYKRRQCPPGPKLTPRAFYRDRRFPITNRYRMMGGV